MRWVKSHRASPAGRVIADRHYNRQKVGSPQFVPPGRCLVLVTETNDALWVTSWPFAEYVQHAWGGAWMCSCFRREPCSADKASELIVEAVAATLAYYGDPPSLGMVTFIDPTKVQPIKVRGRVVFGWTWIKAGFIPCGTTKGGLLAFQLTPDRMPSPACPQGYQPSLIA